jgi:hypothetical protein
MKISLIVFFLISMPSMAEQDDYWVQRYQQCFQSADVVVEGKVTNYKKIGYNGSDTFGYSHYLVSLELQKSLKGFDGGVIDYHVWYEGKEHNIKGSSLFCLCKNDKDEFADPEGFGRLSLGEHYQNFLSKRAAGKITPIDENGKYYVPYCSA